MKKSLWIILILVILIIVGVITYLKLSPNEKSFKSQKSCSDYIAREECAKDSRCEWPGPSCAIPGENCGVAYNPALDRCLPKK